MFFTVFLTKKCIILRLVQKSQIDITFGFVDYLKSENSVYVLLGENKGYYIKNSAKLYNETMQSLVYDFGIRFGIETEVIQGDAVFIARDKTIFQYAERPEAGNPVVSKTGIFGNDGLIQLLQKDNINLNS